jgi:hypothetical protein
MERTIFVALALVACTPGAGPVEGLSDPTQLVASGAAFCAVDAREVACWPSGRREPVGEVVRIPGVGRPRSVAMTLWSACALDHKGVECWALPPGGSTRSVGALANATDLVAVDDAVCGLAGGEVYCLEAWDGDETRIEALSGAKSLHAAGYEVCATFGDGLRCGRWWIKEGFFQPTGWFTGIDEPDQLNYSSFLGELVAFEDGRILTARFPPSQVRDPGSSFPGSPVAVGVAAALDGPVALVERTGGSWALDSGGLKLVMVEVGDGRASAVEYPSAGKPDGLWSGPEHWLYLRMGDDLVQFSTKTKGPEFVVKGVVHPEVVAHGFYAGCALDSTGVECWPFEPALVRILHAIF